MNIDWSKAPEGAEFARIFMSKIFWFKSTNEGAFWLEWYEHRSEWRPTSMNCAVHSSLVKRPESEWAGEGLPPVGTVCEWHGPNSDGPNGWVYAESKVVAYTEDGLFVCMQAPSCWPVVQRIDNCEFRPIRTPEQIAVEEKKAAIEQTIKDLKAVNGCGFYSIAEDLYDAGYRKQVQP